MAFSRTLPDARVSEVSRRLRSRADGILAAVWFMPEAAQGFPSLAGRVACLGRVRGEVAAALLAPLHPSSTARAIDEAWRVHDPEDLLSERLAAATRYLASVIGEQPEGVDRAVDLLRPVVESAPAEGHPLYAGLCSLPWPGTPLGDLWRACDMVRERRGGSHLNAWVAAGLDPVELLLLTVQWRAKPNPGLAGPGEMGWSEADAAASRERLCARGLLDGDGHITDAGRQVRDEVELATDRQERPVVEALGDDVDELFDLLAPWARAVVSGAELPRPDGRGA